MEGNQGMKKIRDALEWIPILMPYRLWITWYRIRHPIFSYRDWRKWANRPEIGDLVEDCRGHNLRVVGFGASDDELVLADGSKCSWMNCCDRPKGRHRRIEVER